MNFEYWLSFDDGAASDMRIAELLDKHNLMGTFFIPVMWQSYNLLTGKEPLTRGEVQQLADRFEIGSHTITHSHLTRIPYAMAEYEIIASKRSLQDLFGQPVESFCYPRGYGTDSLRDIVREHYKLARNTLVGSTEKSEDVAWQNCSVHLGYQRKEYGTTGWFDYAIKMLKKSKYFVAFAHSWELDKYNGWNALDRFLGELSAHSKLRA